MTHDGETPMSRLGDVLTLKRGYDLPEHSRRGGNVPVVSSSGVTGYHSDAKVTGPGVVTGRYGTLGEVFYIRSSFWPLNTSLYVQDFKGNDPRFCAYLLKSLQLGRGSAASAVPGINRNHLHELLVRRPPLDVQRRIAGILSAYDDLIEVNTRRIAILEEMARRLFDEWFAKFRFLNARPPVMADSTLGPIPQGWGIAPLEELYRTSSGGTPSRREPAYFGGDIAWVKTKELRGRPIFATEECISELGLRNSSAHVFPSHTVLIAMYGATIGELGVLMIPAATNQACCALLPLHEEYGWAYAYLTLTVHKQRLVDLRVGAAQQNVSQAVIRRLPVLKVPRALLLEFNRLVVPLLELSFSLYESNSNLRAARDLLLPKLISGEIDLDRAGRDVEVEREAAE